MKKIIKINVSSAIVTSVLQMLKGIHCMDSKLLLPLCLLIGMLPQLYAQEMTTTNLQNVWRQTYIQADGGKTRLGENNEKATWVLEKTSVNNEVRLKQQDSGAYLHAETDARYPAVGAIQPGWFSAIWIFEPIAGSDYVRIKNKWRGTYLHTESGPLEIGSIQPGWLSAQWKQYLASSISWPDSPQNAADGWVSFVNMSGYVARYTFKYTLDGKTLSLSTGNMELGKEQHFTIPGRATNILVKGEGMTGLLWEPWRTTFEKTFTTPPNQCFKSFGTTLNQQWDNNCN